MKAFYDNYKLWYKNLFTFWLNFLTIESINENKQVPLLYVYHNDNLKLSLKIFEFLWYFLTFMKHRFLHLKLIAIFFLFYCIFNLLLLTEINLKV